MRAATWGLLGGGAYPWPVARGYQAGGEWIAFLAVWAMAGAALVCFGAHFIAGSARTSYLRGFLAFVAGRLVAAAPPGLVLLAAAGMYRPPHPAVLPAMAAAGNLGLLLEWLIISRLFHVSYGRAALAWAPTLALALVAAAAAVGLPLATYDGNIDRAIGASPPVAGLVYLLFLLPLVLAAGTFLGAAMLWTGLRHLARCGRMSYAEVVGLYSAARAAGWGAAFLMALGLGAAGLPPGLLVAFLLAVFLVKSYFNLPIGRAILAWVPWVGLVLAIVAIAAGLGVAGTYLTAR